MDGALPQNGAGFYSALLIVLTVILHVIGLGLFNVKLVEFVTAARERRYFMYAFSFGIGLTALWATFLHAVEAMLWAGAYRFVGALPDMSSALLYSLSAIRTYGTPIYCWPRQQAGVDRWHYR